MKKIKITAADFGLDEKEKPINNITFNAGNWYLSSDFINTTNITNLTTNTIITTNATNIVFYDNISNLSASTITISDVEEAEINSRYS